MILRYGNIWDGLCGGMGVTCTDLLLFPANAIVMAKSYQLVMGAGFAKQVADRHPEVQRTLGAMIASRAAMKGFAPAKGHEYGICVGGKLPYGKDGKSYRIGAFQTKVHWMERSSLELVELSTRTLLNHMSRWRIRRVDMVFPAIGLGGLEKADVLPIISVLPDTVHVWQPKEK